MSNLQPIALSLSHIVSGSIAQLNYFIIRVYIVSNYCNLLIPFGSSDPEWTFILHSGQRLEESLDTRESGPSGSAYSARGPPAHAYLLVFWHEIAQERVGCGRSPGEWSQLVHNQEPLWHRPAKVSHHGRLRCHTAHNR